MSSTVAAAGELAQRVDEVTGRAGPGRSLRHGSLRFLRTAALPVGVQGPTAGVIIGPAIIAGIVGEPGALAQVLALVAMGFVAYAFVVFSRSFNTAGSVYAFNGSALGPGYGFVSAWLLLLVYLSFAAGVYASTADIGQALLASFGVHLGWVWLGLAGAVLALALAFTSIGFGSLVILLCEGVAVALITVVAIAVLAAGGYHHHGITAAPFSAHGVSLPVLALGLTAAFGQFSGFESAATLGEEARRSTRIIPAAIGWSLAGAAAVYIFFTWVVYVAYPGPAAIAASPAPLVSIADVYPGRGTRLATPTPGRREPEARRILRVSTPPVSLRGPRATVDATPRSRARGGWRPPGELRLHQATAAFLALTSPRRAEMIVGPAGTGRTFTAVRIAHAWRAEGKGQVVGSPRPAPGGTSWPRPGSRWPRTPLSSSATCPATAKPAARPASARTRWSSWMRPPPPPCPTWLPSSATPPVPVPRWSSPASTPSSAPR